MILHKSFLFFIITILFFSCFNTDKIERNDQKEEEDYKISKKALDTPDAGPSGSNSSGPSSNHSSTGSASDSSAPAEIDYSKPSSNMENIQPSSLSGFSQDHPIEPEVVFLDVEETFVTKPFVIDDEFLTDFSPTNQNHDRPYLNAGYADDNKQFGYFIRFLNDYKQDVINPIPIVVDERIVITVEDSSKGKISNATICIYNEDTLLVKGKTLSDGCYQFNPSEYSEFINEYYIECMLPSGEVLSKDIRRDGRRNIVLSSDTESQIHGVIPIDIVITLDSIENHETDDIIDSLKKSLMLINNELSDLTYPLEIRYGLVQYCYYSGQRIIHKISLTENFPYFLDQLNIKNGNSNIEDKDLFDALNDTIDKMEWNNLDSGIRLNYLITNSPYHSNNNKKDDYYALVKTAREKAIRMHTIGTWGLPIEGEYLLRQISQYTNGKFIFLSNEDSGDNDGGTIRSVSHHTGSNWNAESLESIIIDTVKNDILSNSNVDNLDESYFTAMKVEVEENEETLEKLFTRALQQLSDISSLTITPDMGIAVLPIEDLSGQNNLSAEYFTDHLHLLASSDPHYSIVDRKDFDLLLKEQRLQLSGITEDTLNFGNLTSAEILLTGQLYRKDNNYEIFLKLLRVETSEILSMTKALVDLDLGI